MAFFFILFFAAGLFACIPLAARISPPSALLITSLFAPWMLLNIFSEHPMVARLQNLYLTFIIGMCCYWTYYEIKKKMNNR